MNARSADDAEIIVNKYGRMLFKMCLVMLCNEQDAEDALQEAFLRFIKRDSEFMNPEHEKAWIVKVTANICKDIRRFKIRNYNINLDDINEYYCTEEKGEILEAVMALPLKYKLVIHLYYVEGYKVEDIAGILGISQSAVKKRLQRGRQLLKLEYERS